ncbi:hypothetical protein LCGC14_0617620 [marine sediment metagenome]|uniref:Uncharacterized protein n=1 Tax=marine sediment metagenome TaxID=412755 RepID=A0A0F9R5T3_9ZZZZ
MSTKKDISQYNACTTWKPVTVLANLKKHEFSSGIHELRVVNDYSINNSVVDYADSEKIKENQPFNSEISIQCLSTDLVRLSQFSFSFLLF